MPESGLEGLPAAFLRDNRVRDGMPQQCLPCSVRRSSFNKLWVACARRNICREQCLREDGPLRFRDATYDEVAAERSPAGHVAGEEGPDIMYLVCVVVVCRRELDQ